MRSSARGSGIGSKRFYKKPEAEARTNDDLAAALDQIETGPDLPETLGILKALQGGDDQSDTLVSYENGSFTSGAENTIEWMVDGVDQDFSRQRAGRPGAASARPFTVGQTAKLRTRVRTGGGTTTDRCGV